VITGDDLRRHLNEMIESPEPTSEGAWYSVDLQDLINRGSKYIEIHFDQDAVHPNGVRLLDEDGE
jgi:hypothetical protein